MTATTAAVGQVVTGGALIAGTVAGAPLLRHRYNRWGATDEELTRPLPGDELVKDPKLTYTRAVTIDAPPEQVWPWLVQFGQGRGGFYSYDAVENLIGCGIHSTDRILPEHQELQRGDIIRSGGRDTYPCWVVMDVEPPHALVLQGAGTPGDVQVPEVVDVVPGRGYAASTWQWVLEPVDDGGRTRLLVRQRCTYSPDQRVLWHVVEPLNFVMERKMLLGIKARAEDRQHTRNEAVPVAHGANCADTPTICRAAVIGIATAVGGALLIWGRRRFGPHSTVQAFLVAWVPMTWLGTVSRVAQPRVPASYLELRGFEQDGRVYEVLGVRWAKQLLRRGPFAVFNPGLHLPVERTPEGLAQLEQRMEDAEASHAILFVATSGLVIRAARHRRWTFAGLTLLFNALCNGYPVMLQRYNRALLHRRFGSPVEER